MASTACLVLVVGSVPTLAAPAMSAPADPVPTDAADPAERGPCLGVSDLLMPQAATGLRLVPPPTGCLSGASTTSGTSGASTAPGSPGGTITDADGNSYQCTVQRGFNDACPSMVSVPYGPGGDPQGELVAYPTQTVASPDGGTVYVVGHELVPTAAVVTGQYNTVVVAYAADTGAFRWTRVIEPQAPHTGAFLARGATVSHDGTRLYLQGMMTSDATWDAYAAALDTATGQVAWQKPITSMLLNVPTDWFSYSSGGIGVSPDGTRIYLADSVLHAGALPFNINSAERPWYLALDATTGDLIWATEYTPAAAQSAATGSFDHPALELTADGSRVLAQAAMYGPEGNQGFTMLAFDAATGDPQWADEHEYPAADEGHQNPPLGLALSPGGDRVYAAYNPWQYDAEGHIEHTSWAVKAWDTATGQAVWTREYADTEWTPQTGCDTPTYVFGPRPFTISPSGDTVYLFGQVGTQSSNCEPYDPGVLALDTATGQPVWATAYDEYSNGSPSSGCLRSCWEIFIAPGPGGGDPGSTVYVLMAFYPDDAIPTASCGGQVPCLSYGMAIGFDGQSGTLTKQLRWIDTFYEPPENDTDGGGAFNRSLGGAAVSPDGSRLFVTQSVSSRPRDWDVVFQILGYDTRGR